MHEDKIIQIIPAPADMWAVHRGNDGEENYECWCRIVCLALVECPEDGSRIVRPMEMFEGDIMVDFADEIGRSDVCGVAYATVEEARRRGVVYDLAVPEQ